MEKIQVRSRALTQIDKLWLSFERFKEDTQRAKIRSIESLFQQMLQEIAYASEILVPTLAESLMSDTPQTQSSLVLNETIVQIGKNICNPALKDEFQNSVQAYLHDRKKTESQYAISILNEIFSPEMLKMFPERTHEALITLPLPIIEKVINEKQLRRVFGHKLQSLLVLVEPWLYHRLFNLELDRVRAAYQLPFRKFINTIAQDAFDKIQDEKTLQTIQKEKESAFLKFKEFLITNTPLPLQLEKLQDKLKVCYIDRSRGVSRLEQLLNEFLPPAKLTTNEGVLSSQLRARFFNKVRQDIHLTESNAAIYETDDTIHKTHEILFNELTQEANALKNLILIVSSIWNNFGRKILQAIAQASTLKKLEESLLDVVLGKPVAKKSFITGEVREIREDGYPQKTIKELYASMIAELNAIQQTCKGLFFEKIRAEILRAQEELTVSANLLDVSIPKSSPAQVASPTFIEPAPMSPSLEELVKASAQQDANTAPIISAPTEEQPQVKITLKPKVPSKHGDGTSPIILEPIKKMDDVSAPASTAVKEPTENTFVPKPLEINVEFEPDLPETPIDNPAEVAATSLTLENPTLQAAFDAGTLVMQNYQLGDFEKPILQAWKLMIQAPDDAIGGGEGLLLSSENEVKLYVICDLAQQISTISEASLSKEQNATLQKVKQQILKALENPLDETHWDYFEGTNRDYIDGALSTL